MTATLSTPMPTEAGSQSAKKPVDREALSARLLGSAAKKSYDPVVDIDWAAPIPDELYGLSPEWSTLYGTPMWDALSAISFPCSAVGGCGIWPSPTSPRP